MRALKAVGLGLVAAIAAMAVFGAGTASATIDFVTLCKAKELVCNPVNQYPAGTEIKANLEAGTEAVLTGSLEVKCKTSSVTLKTEGEPLAKLLLGKITALSFSNCTNCPTVKALPPFEAHLKNLGNLQGLLVVLNPMVHLEGCFGFVNCLAEATEVSLDVHTEVTPARVDAINEPLKISGGGGFCGTSGTWNAKYVLASPTPLYIEG